MLQLGHHTERVPELHVALGFSWLQNIVHASIAVTTVFLFGAPDAARAASNTYLPHLQLYWIDISHMPQDNWDIPTAISQVNGPDGAAPLVLGLCDQPALRNLLWAGYYPCHSRTQGQGILD